MLKNISGNIVKYFSVLNSGGCAKSRGYLSCNSQFQNHKYNIISNLSMVENKSVDQTYKILNDIALYTTFKASNIRITYLSKDRDRCDIRGVKLLGYVDDMDSNVPWIVIVGGKESNSWSSINLSLYLATLFSYRALEKYDLLIFPIHSPHLYKSSDLESNESNVQSLFAASQHYQQPHINLPLISCKNNNFVNSNNTSTSSKYNHANNSNTTSQKEIFNEWLKKSNRKFQYLALNLNEFGSPVISTNQFNHNRSNIINPYFAENGDQSIQSLNKPKNYILELKDLPQSFEPTNNDKLFNTAKEIQKEIQLFENFNTKSNKSF